MTNREVAKFISEVLTGEKYGDRPASPEIKRAVHEAIKGDPRAPMSVESDDLSKAAGAMKKDRDSKKSILLRAEDKYYEFEKEMEDFNDKNLFFPIDDDNDEGDWIVKNIEEEDDFDPTDAFYSITDSSQVELHPDGRIVISAVDMTEITVETDKHGKVRVIVEETDREFYRKSTVLQEGKDSRFKRLLEEARRKEFM